MTKLPEFKSEQEESEFWDSHELTDYLDETAPVDVQFVDARPRKTLISLRMPPEVIAQLKDLAHARGIGYQTLIRMWVMERLTMEGAGAPTIPPRQQAG